MGLIASGALTRFYFGSGAVGSGAVASGQIGVNHFASGSVDAQLANTGAANGARTVSDATVGNSGLLFTPTATGMYRVSLATQVTQGGLLNAGSLTVALNWTDDTQGQTLSPITGVALITSGAFGQSTSVMRVLSGTPIFMTVALGAVTGTPHYNAFGAVERVT